MRLTINSFDSLAPIWQSSGVLCISHPHFSSAHSLVILSLAPLLHRSSKFRSPNLSYCAYVPSCDSFFRLSFWGTDQSMVCPREASQNCTVSPDRVLCLVGLGLKPSCQGPVVWLLYSIHLGFGTEPFFSSQDLLPIHRERPTTSQPRLKTTIPQHLCSIYQRKSSKIVRSVMWRC